MHVLWLRTDSQLPGAAVPKLQSNTASWSCRIQCEHKMISKCCIFILPRKKNKLNKKIVKLKSMGTNFCLKRGTILSQSRESSSLFKLKHHDVAQFQPATSVFVRKCDFRFSAGRIFASNIQWYIVQRFRPPAMMHAESRLNGAKSTFSIYSCDAVVKRFSAHAKSNHFCMKIYRFIAGTSNCYRMDNTGNT